MSWLQSDEHFNIYKIYTLGIVMSVTDELTKINQLCLYQTTMYMLFSREKIYFQ